MESDRTPATHLNGTEESLDNAGCQWIWRVCVVAWGLDKSVRACVGQNVGHPRGPVLRRLRTTTPYL